MAVSKTEAGAQRRSRIGRPPRELAGEVDARILDAAHRVFLERGLAGASMDEIASRAGAGKPTIYARFPGKEALFTAVMLRLVDDNIARFRAEIVLAGDIRERLVKLACALLQWVLAGDTIGLLRLAVAEARRFPELANNAGQSARARGRQAVAQLLAEVAQREALGATAAFAPDRLDATAELFLDIAMLPLLMRALLGEKQEVLQAQIEPHVVRSVAFFLSGCRNGGVA
jgi:AcrR family transcriptional regulator